MAGILILEHGELLRYNPDSNRFEVLA